MRPLVLFLCLLVVSCESVSLTPFATVETPSIALAPCHIDGLAEEILCGTHDVPENRDGPSQRQLQIRIAVLPVLRGVAEPDPLVLMAGGPGQGARGLAPVAARFFRKVRSRRDIVLVDLRGTGASHPLKCSQAADEIAVLEHLDFAAQARQCAEGLENDPRMFTHANSLRDLEEIRQRLGYERINLWGGSWGTRASLLYALRYPASTRSVILDGAVALTMDFPRTASADADDALTLLFDTCQKDAECTAAFPDPRAAFAALDRQFLKDRIRVTIRHPRTHALTRVTLTKGLVAEMIRGALYVPRDAAAILQLIRHATAGDFAPLAAQYLRTASVTTDDMTMGATFAVLCSEDLPRVAAANFEDEARGSAFGTTYAQAWRDRCGAWPAGRGLRDDTGATSSAPALILSGAHDPVTPPRAGTLMAKHFAQHWHVIVPGAAHNASFSGCVPDLIATFIDKASGDGIDTSCATEVPWPPFVVSDAGSVP